MCLSLLGHTRTYSVLISTARHTTRDSIGLHSWYSSQYFSPLDFQCKAVPWWLSEHSRQLSHCAILCRMATYTKPEVTNQHRSFNHPLVAHGMQKLHVYLLFHTLSSFTPYPGSLSPPPLSTTHSQALTSFSSKVKNVVKKVEPAG